MQRRASQLDPSELLDRVEEQLLAFPAQERVPEALDPLFANLQLWRRTKSDAEWAAIVDACRQHSLRGLLHQDPFSARAYAKPRGYAGDACMMDMIYSIEDHTVHPPLGPFGKRVFDYLMAGPACQGVRARRALVARTIDRLAERRKRPHVLSIAAGHLREASLSVAIRRRLTGRLLAVDADAESLAEVSACYAKFGVETLTSSFTGLFRSGTYEGKFDLVYSTGLFDYLPLRTGRRLTSAMHGMLRPGGSLLIANFLPDVRDAGYLEAFLDWRLVYRSRKDMIDLTLDLPEAEVEKVELWSEEAQNIIFLRVTRK